MTVFDGWISLHHIDLTSERTTIKPRRKTAVSVQRITHLKNLERLPVSKESRDGPLKVQSGFLLGLK